MTEELKPCPLCQSLNISIDEMTLFFPTCNNCGCTGGGRETEQEAIADWNTRPEPKEAWQPIAEFCKEANEGWCWIVHKGRTEAAYRDHQGYFRQSWGSIHNYMTECITFAMAWDAPEPPKE